jgi:hypothetical protein
MIFFFLSKRINILNKKHKVQRLGDIKPDPATNQKEIHRDKTIPGQNNPN